MDQILNSILEEYNRLLGLYEKVYEKFKNSDPVHIDDYLRVINESGSCIEDISQCQKRLDKLRGDLNIHSDILIDSILESYSRGKIVQINSRIEEIINFIKSCGKKGMDILKTEDEKIQNDLNDLGFEDSTIRDIKGIL